MLKKSRSDLIELLFKDSKLEVNQDKWHRNLSAAVAGFLGRKVGKTWSQLITINLFLR
jgi:hypothetical protein